MVTAFSIARIVVYLALFQTTNVLGYHLRNGLEREALSTFFSRRILSIENFGAQPDDTDGVPTFPQFDDDATDYYDVSKNSSATMADRNTRAFNLAIETSRPGDVVLIPEGKSFVVNGGILVNDKHNITLDFAGSLHFVSNRTLWPFNNPLIQAYDSTDRYNPAILLFNCTNVTMTSSSKNRARVQVNYRTNAVKLVNSHDYFGGIINGNGKQWWDDKITGDLEHHRARMIQIMESANILVENLTLLNSPYWTLTIEAIDSEVRNVNVLVDRKYEVPAKYQVDFEPEMTRFFQRFGDMVASGIPIPNPIDELPDWIGRKFRQPQDLNTDGIDPSGRNIWVHDCIIQNADDSVSIKPMQGGRPPSRIPDCTSNITVENMVLTGFGASVGSVPGGEHHLCIDNITFRNITMPGTGKGIYVKSDWGPDSCTGNSSGQITNILYEDVSILQPFWWSLWIGPQQIHEPHSKLHLACALTWPVDSHCPVAGCVNVDNITLRNISIMEPLLSPGVIKGNSSNPMKNIVIDGLKVVNSKRKFWHGKWPFYQKHYPWEGKFKCSNAGGWYNNSNPEPECLDSM